MTESDIGGNDGAGHQAQQIEMTQAEENRDEERDDKLDEETGMNRISTIFNFFNQKLPRFYVVLDKMSR